jgi:hypothetical protein
MRKGHGWRAAMKMAQADFRVHAKNPPHRLPVKVQRGKSGGEPEV